MLLEPWFWKMVLMIGLVYLAGECLFDIPQKNRKRR